MKIKNMILLVSVIIIFMLFASYNIGSYIVHQKYNEVTEINDKLDEVISLVGDNQEAIDILEDINEDVLFLNTFCMGEEE